MNGDTDIRERLRTGVITDSPGETLELARNLAFVLPPDQVLALHGDLGVGKTTFVKGLAEAWNISGTITSPTFNLYTIYRGDRRLLHLDAYRLNSTDQLDALMIEDFLISPWCLAVEWPERIAPALPADTWHLHLGILAGGRHSLTLETQNSGT